MKRVLTIFAIFSFIISCNESKQFETTAFRRTVFDTFTYERVQQVTKVLNYSTLNNGVDSFELRLWTDLGHTDFKSVKVLKYEDSNWHFSETRYWISGDSIYPNRGSKVFLDSGNIEFSRLTVPISLLLDSLYKLDFNTFLDQEKIPGFVDNVADGLYYNLEIATKNYYRHLFYHEPNRYYDSSNKNFCRILRLLRAKKIYN